jgi:hypothetical protein
MSGRERTARNSAELPFPAQFQISLLRHRLRPRQADDHQPYLRLRVGDEGQSIIVVSTGISITCLSFRCLRSLIGNVRPDGIRVCRQECRNYDTTGGVDYHLAGGAMHLFRPRWQTNDGGRAEQSNFDRGPVA